MASRPSGTVTFLFTDIEGSTRLLHDLGDRYSILLADHHRLLRAAVREWGGVEVETQGDGLFFVFPAAKAALLASVAAQRAMLAHTWPEAVSVRVRMGLHTGEPMTGETGYVGLDIHRAARICATGHGGQILLSRTTRELVEEAVGERIDFREMGEHRLKDLVRPLQLFQVVVPDLPADFPPLRSLDTFPNNLPRQITSFVGREREVAEIRRLLSTTALLTLTGTGGCGKTRLALQVAADMLEEFTDGVWLVELAELADPALIPQTVASSLGVREQPGRPILTTLSEHLQPKRLLLLLDNCEHVLSDCAHLAEALLLACPHLRILATSREGLGIGGEVAWLVPSLSTPDPQSRSSTGSLMQFEAARLFVERALAAHRAFTVTDGNAATVAQVCRRLDGLPLAIELAAARVKALTVEQIASRLDERLNLLTSGSRTAPPRQQTLRAAMDWSHELLSEQERIILRRLSVFVGGFTLEAAEAVCSAIALEFDVLTQLTHLVDKSLVMAEEYGQEVRYRLLETVRQYAGEKLLEAGETAEVQRKHRDWYLALAERIHSKREGPEQVAGLERLEAEYDNLRAALARSLEDGSAEAGLRLAGSLGWFWQIRGYWSEGRAQLSAVVSLRGISPPSARARALFWAARFASIQRDDVVARRLYDQSLSISRQLGSKRGITLVLTDLGLIAQREGDYEAARSTFEKNLAIYRELDDKEGIGWSLRYLGEVAQRQGDYETARSFFRESLAILRESGSRRAIAHVLEALGWWSEERGDYGAAREVLEESLAIQRDLGDKHRIGWVLTRMGDVARLQGDSAMARRWYEESLTIFRELGDKSWSGSGSVLHRLGRLARLQGDYSAARRLYEESLSILRESGSNVGLGWTLMGLGDVERLQKDYNRAAALYAEAMPLLMAGYKPYVADCLEKFAALARSEGQPGRAARLFGAAEALRDAIGYRLPPADRLEYDRDVSTLQTELGGKAFAEAWSEGRRMSLDQAVEYALARPAG